MKKIIFILTCLLSTQVINAQTTTEEMTPTPRTPHHIGVNAGSITGLGFSYRYWPGRLGVQVTGIPIFSGNSTFFSGGLSALFLLKDNRVADLYAYWGNHIIHTNSDFSAISNTSYQTGLGLGTDITIFENMHLNLQAGYGFYNIGENTITTNFAGGLGLYYNF